jgi:hypothetical protein
MAAGWSPPENGRVTTSTPTKPIPIATSRRGPAHSPRSGPAISATMRGIANWIAMAVVS